MTSYELELQLAHLEDLFDEIVALVNDPDISDRDLCEQLRALVEDANDDE
jgi:hypothetical protein